jgi:hypothetical protein
LELRPNECVEVFLISGSFEERKEYAGDVLAGNKARIVLCSIQYSQQVSETIDYITEEGFDVFVQWINPGFHDNEAYFDRLGLSNQLAWKRATISMRNGKSPTALRVQEIREFIYGWAVYRGLVFPCNPS